MHWKPKGSQVSNVINVSSRTCVSLIFLKLVYAIQNHEWDITLLLCQSLCRDDTASGIETWDWNLNGEKCAYHALFPRAWTTYEGKVFAPTGNSSNFWYHLQHSVFCMDLSKQVNLTQNLQLFLAKFHLLFPTIIRRAASQYQYLLIRYERECKKFHLY